VISFLGRFRYDVIIIGDGPSGASAGLSDHAISYLDFELPEDIIEWEVTGAKIIFRDQSIEAHKDRRGSAFVSRSKFDNFLLEKAKEVGIEVHTGEKALCCREMPDLVEVDTSVMAI